MSNAHIAQTEGIPNLSDGFAQEVQEIDALALFAKALPGWVMSHGKGVRFVIQCGGPDVSIDIGLSQGATAEQSDDLLRTLKDWERLQRLTLLIDEFRNVGVSTEVIDPMIDEAETLARRLAPEFDDE